MAPEWIDYLQTNMWKGREGKGVFHGVFDESSWRSFALQAPGKEFLSAPSQADPIQYATFPLLVTRIVVSFSRLISFYINFLLKRMKLVENK